MPGKQYRFTCANAHGDFIELEEFRLALAELMGEYGVTSVQASLILEETFGTPEDGDVYVNDLPPDPRYASDVWFEAVKQAIDTARSGKP